MSDAADVFPAALCPACAALVASGVTTPAPGRFPQLAADESLSLTAEPTESVRELWSLYPVCGGCAAGLTAEPAGALIRTPRRR